MLCNDFNSCFSPASIPSKTRKLPRRGQLPRLNSESTTKEVTQHKAVHSNRQQVISPCTDRCVRGPNVFVMGQNKWPRIIDNETAFTVESHDDVK